MLVPDTVLQGRYRIVRQLGQGGMGTVFEAVDERLDTTIALKQTLFADERLRKQFEREARLLARLHHPALPRVSDHFSEGEGQFLVMQFIAGEDFSEMIAKRRGPFPVDQVLSWADQLLDALDYLHTQDPQIIHRDIKPQNLKQTARGQIILLDFGLAKGQTSEVGRVTTSASIFGYTPNYAPLEQVQGLGTDPRSDIYSLSATLYHLLTATKPPDALTRAAAIVNGQPDPLQSANEINSAVSADVAQVLQKAMSQNRDQRYRTAAEMRRALQGANDGVTVSNRSEADTVLFAKPTVVAPTLANVNQPTAHGAEQRPTVAPGETTVVRPAASSRKTFSPWLMAAIVAGVLAVGGFGFYAYKQKNQATETTSAQPTPAQLTQAPSPAETVQSAPNETINHVSVKPTNEASTTESTPSKEAAKAKADRAALAKEKAAEKEAEKQAEREALKKFPKIEVPPHPQNDQPPETNAPNIEVPDTPRNGPGRPSRRRFPSGVIVRTFPDGTEMVTTPDGTRIVTSPNGRRRVYRPGEQINPRRVAP